MMIIFVDSSDVGGKRGRSEGDRRWPHVGVWATRGGGGGGVDESHHRQDERTIARSKFGRVRMRMQAAEKKR